MRLNVYSEGSLRRVIGYTPEDRQKVPLPPLIERFTGRFYRLDKFEQDLYETLDKGRAPRSAGRDFELLAGSLEAGFQFDFSEISTRQRFRRLWELTQKEEYSDTVEK